MTDGQLQLLLEFLQRVGLLRRGDDVQQKITVHQFQSLIGTATYHTTLLDALPARRPVGFVMRLDQFSCCSVYLTHQ